jgi:3-deoxy-7-phosphoheptulonate synthase
MTTETLAQINKVNNLNIESEKVLITPRELKEKLPLPPSSAAFVSRSRQQIEAILDRKDPRKIAIVGPCSIHDITSAKEYALKLKQLAKEVEQEIYLVMRVYFEKPRTTVGWKGLINDPNLNNSFDVEKGLEIARELLLWLAENEIPVATEMLDPISPQYLSELITWTAIGARTSESQTHREMASGLSMPIGFKNGTSGSSGAALNAMKAAASGHSFMGINNLGQVTLLNTTGNRHGHVILRGGNKPNYHPADIAQYEEKLRSNNLPNNIMVDCSHGNSNKDPSNQPDVLENVIGQVVDGNQSIIGFMLESHLKSGNQKIKEDLSQLEYGVSITDACIDWQTTEDVLIKTAHQLNETNLQTKALRNGITF